MCDAPLFETEICGDTLVVVPTRNLGEFEIANMGTAADSPFQKVLDLTEGRNVVVDLTHTDYFGSSTIGLFNQLLTRVRGDSHRIAFCNLSAHEHEVIQIAQVHQFWDVRDSREEALEYVSSPPCTQD